jgi:O-antigen/teichoic acid export membrane protein
MSFVVNLLLIRVGLEMIDAASYGVWLVLSSLVTWISLADIGLGNAIRNAVAVALAHKDTGEARRYVSTGYVLIAAISIVVLILAVAVIPVVNWSVVLNAPDIANDILWPLAMIAALCFCLRLLAGLVGFLLLGAGRAALSAVIDLATNVSALIALLGLKDAGIGSLFSLGSTLSIVAVVVPVFSTVLVFKSRSFCQLRPSLRSLDMRLTGQLLGSGIRFFVINSAAMIMFASSNVIIAHVCGPDEVTVYNVALKYFGLLTIGFSVALTPFWSAFTDAFASGEELWVRSVMRRLVAIWGGTVVMAIVMVILSPAIVRLWIGESVEIPLVLACVFGLYVCVTNWNSLFAYFLNGVGRIQLQMLLAVFLLAVYIPLSLFLSSELRLGLMGVVFASILSQSVGAVVQPLQYRRVISGTAHGIWAK